MQDARERLELAQEAGKIGVFDADLRTGRSVWISSRQATRPARAVFDDWRAAWAQRLIAETAAALALIWTPYLQGSETRFSDTWRMVRADGTVHWYECSARIPRDAQARPSAWWA